MRKYRYRFDGGNTRGALRGMRIALPKIGKPLVVRGVRYLNRYSVPEEAVIVVGTKGTAHFTGVLWGYGGQGARGLVQLLRYLGIQQERAELVAFETPRCHPLLGTDWELEFLLGNKLRFRDRRKIEREMTLFVLAEKRELKQWSRP